jgi:hypothetical protein
MKKITRRTEISLQRTKRLVVLRPKTEAILLCPQCERGEAMLIAEQAASVFGFSRREIYQLVETEQVHFSETAEGFLYICPISLLKNNTDKRSF